ncbi:MAG: hypothetical protein ACHQ1D_09000 [Nitrososphaerales archaeon]
MRLKKDESSRIKLETFNLLPPVLMNSNLAKDMVTMDSSYYQSLAMREFLLLVA